MSFLDGNERSTTRVANLPAGYQFRLDRRAIVSRFNNARFQCNDPVDRRRAKKLYMEIGRYRAGSLVLSPLFHEMVCGRPVRMAIEQGTDDAAVKHTWKGLVMRLGTKLCNELLALDKTADAKSLVILRSAAETDSIW